MLLIQFADAAAQRHVGLLDPDSLCVRTLTGYRSTYELAQAAIRLGRSLCDLASESLGSATWAYADLEADGRVLPPLDHPDPAHCLVTGTGLTHLGSADARNAMHAQLDAAPQALTDSMRMFKLGLEGGKPAPGAVGVQPEWFYKGDGSIVRASGQPLQMPAFAEDGGEEPEIAGLYVNGPDGHPCRVGFALGNEFSDHVVERGNYLWLAHSKLRECGLGPALWVGELPAHIEGRSRVRGADGQVRWEKPFLSGEANMSHSIANLEHHHFKYGLFRRPGDVHVHFFGTATLSFADGVKVVPGETFEVEAQGFGPALRQMLRVAETPDTRVTPL